ncbi:MAG: CHASE domain-containing protein [Micromonosporaceae bacterium]|nr:CHASE domain-containing protein [Micromonosporaceae bacterium]
MSSDQTGTYWRRLWRSIAPAFLVFVVGAGGTGVAASAFNSAEHRHADAALTRRARDLRVAVSAELERYVDTLQDLSVATAAQTDLTERDFITITSRIRHERLPGTGAVLFIDANGEVRFGREIGETGAATTAGSSEAMTVLAPNGPDREAASSAEAAIAMALARESGQITASRPRDQVDVARAETHPTTVLAGPVYAGPADPGNPGAGALLGWVVVTVRIDDAIDQPLRDAADRSTRIAVADATDPGDPVHVAGVARGGAAGNGGGTSRQVEFVVAQRTWMLTATATSPLVSGPAAYTDEATLAGGLLITVLLCGVAWLLATSRERALAGVQQATAALRADIARREAVEAQLREREAELAGFIALTAHDLRTPMTNVAAYADLLAEVAAEDLDSTCQGFLERIGTGTRRMTRLIDDLLDFSTAGTAPLRPEAVDLGRLCADVVSEHTTHRGDSRPSVDFGPLPTVQGDPATLTRLLDNLISNAIKYVRHGDTAQIAIGARKEPNGWRIEVADRGIGIPPEQRQAVFAAFHRDRAAEGYPGTGLGLAICKRIVERHGGDIGVEQNPGGGSRFWFTLPETLPPELSIAGERKAQPEKPPAPLRPGRSVALSANRRRSADRAHRRSAAGPS